MKKALFFVLALVILSAVAYLATHKQEPQMVIRVGYATVESFQHQGGPPKVEPIKGVEVLMIDREFTLLNVGTTDKKGEVRWPRSEKPATVIVTVDGQRYSADVTGGSGNDEVVIGVLMPESVRSL